MARLHFKSAASQCLARATSVVAAQTWLVKVGISRSSYFLAVSPGYRRLRSSTEGPEAEAGWLTSLGRGIRDIAKVSILQMKCILDRVRRVGRKAASVVMQNLASYFGLA